MVASRRVFLGAPPSPYTLKLLDAARGFFLRKAANHDPNKRQRVMRCFPLRQRHLRRPSPATTPSAFHQTLCDQIRQARDRVCLASLYIGTGASAASSSVHNGTNKEQELLDALRCTRARSVRILLDQNRALRPVPVVDGNNSTEQTSSSSSTITSAEACHRALQQRQPQAAAHAAQQERAPGEDSDDENSNGLFLLSVLPSWQQQLLRNPLNEVAGVFHLKCYICDNNLMITGANLSEEYFSDRTDRYLWITEQEEEDVDATTIDSNSSPKKKKKKDTAPSLVDCYADLVRALCRHATPYHGNEQPTTNPKERRRTTRRELLESLTKILTTTTPEDDHCINEEKEDVDDAIVAYAVPTLQVPPSFFGRHNPIPSDADLVSSLLETAATDAATGSANNHQWSEVRLASAYLNPTDQLMRSLRSTPTACSFTNIHWLTAGHASHGFKPKNKAGNKGKAWIPAVYDALGRKAVERQQQKQQSYHHLWYYSRPGWTFHCKGLWLTRHNDNNYASSGNNNNNNVGLDDSCTISAVVTGSGNYGYRSDRRDMESNVILLLVPPSGCGSSTLQERYRREWNELCHPHAVPAAREPRLPLSWSLRRLLPVIRYFF